MDHSKTGPYQQIRRKLPKRASASDIHEDTVPLVTDIKTLEKFAAALQAFDASQTQMERQRKGYRISTVVLTVLFGLSLSKIIVEEVREWNAKDHVDVGPAIEWSEIEQKINQRLSETKVSALPTTTSKEKISEIVVMQIQLLHLADLQIEHNAYLAKILSGNRRLPEKPATLLDAERRARTLPKLDVP